jgi:hypothetical protein
MDLPCSRKFGRGADTYPPQKQVYNKMMHRAVDLGGYFERADQRKIDIKFGTPEDRIFYKPEDIAEMKKLERQNYIYEYIKMGKSCCHSM